MQAGSFAALTAVFALAAASSAAAQRPSLPPPPAPAALSVPDPLTGSAPAALSVPNPLAAMTPGPRDLYRSPDGSDRFQQLAPFPPPPVVFIPGPYFPSPYYFPYGVTDYRPATPHRRSRPIAEIGGLVLESLPDLAQVYVDGFYVGLVQDFSLRGRPLDLPAGAHSIELRAPGYDVLTFSVIIKPNEILRFRGDMQPLPRAAAPRAVLPPAAQKSVYVIPNCYAGDKPPLGTLPRGCDPKKLQARK